MLNFSKLKLLARHKKNLDHYLHRGDSFLVGGAIRDLILGVEQNPQDIDATIAGNPSPIYKQIDDPDLDHFITEKFGTITLLPKQGKFKGIHYEITPLRTETQYDDFRHPKEIIWSEDLLLDAKRRDFSINTIYYSYQELKKPQYQKIQEIKNEENLLKILTQQGFIYLSNTATLILQNHNYIQQIFPKGQIDLDMLYYFLDIQQIAYLWGTHPKDKSTTPSKPPNQKIQIQILIDPFEGIQDLAKKKIRAVGDPLARFEEDALRVLRAIRIPVVLNHQLLSQNKKKEKILTFDFDNDTWKAIKLKAKNLEHIAKERIKEELFKIFSKGSPFNAVALLDEAGILPIIFPALENTKHIDQPIRYHPFDIYAHTLLTLYHLEQLNPDPLARFAMLYHDVGKVGQYQAYGDNLSKEEIRAILAGPLNHRFSSAELAKRDFATLGMSKKEIETIQRYIREHHTPGEILLGDPNNWNKKVRKLLSEAGFEKVDTLFDINIADRMGMYNPLQNSSDLSDSYELKKILRALEKEEGQFTTKDLAIDGNQLIQHFQIKPGKIIGDLLTLALEWVLGDIKKRNDPDQIFANLANHLKNLEKNQPNSNQLVNKSDLEV